MPAYTTSSTTPPNPSSIHAGGDVDQTFVDNLSKTINQAHLQKCRQGFATVFTGTKPTVEQSDTTFNVLKFYAPVPSTKATSVRVSGKVTVTSASTDIQEIELRFGLKGDNSANYQLSSNTAIVYVIPASNNSQYFDHTFDIMQGSVRPALHEFVQIKCDFSMDSANSGDFAELDQLAVNFEQGSLTALEPYQTKTDETGGAATYTGYPLDTARNSTGRALSSAQAWTWKRSLQAIRKMPLLIASMSALRHLPSSAVTHLLGDDTNRLRPYPHIHFCRVPETDKDLIVKAYVETLNGNFTGNKIRMCAFDVGSLLRNDGPSPDHYTRDASFAEAVESIPAQSITNASSVNELRLTMPVPAFRFNPQPTCRFIAVGIAVQSTLYSERFGFNILPSVNPRIVSYGIWCSIDD